MPLASRRSAQGAGEHATAQLVRVPHPHGRADGEREPGARKRERQDQGDVGPPGAQPTDQLPAPAAVAMPRVAGIETGVLAQQLQQRGGTHGADFRLGVGTPHGVEQRSRHETVAEPVGEADEDALGAVHGGTRDATRAQ